MDQIWPTNNCVKNYQTIIFVQKLTTFEYLEDRSFHIEAFSCNQSNSFLRHHSKFCNFCSSFLPKIHEAMQCYIFISSHMKGLALHETSDNIHCAFFKCCKRKEEWSIYCDIFTSLLQYQLEFRLGSILNIQKWKNTDLAMRPF